MNKVKNILEKCIYIFISRNDKWNIIFYSWDFYTVIYSTGKFYKETFTVNNVFVKDCIVFFPTQAEE